ncbi:MAG: MATE family efflux transporter, partial [Methylophilaceae bacterium]
MVLTQLLWMTMPVVDNMMVGHLGAEALAGMAIATTYYWLLQLVCLGILSAV